MHIVMNPILLEWLDDSRNDMSRQAFIIKILNDVKKQTQDTPQDTLTPQNGHYYEQAREDYADASIRPLDKN